LDHDRPEDRVEEEDALLVDSIELSLSLINAGSANNAMQA